MRNHLQSILFSVFSASALCAHDFWIQPKSLRCAPQELVAVELRVGMNFEGDPVARNPERLLRFESYAPGAQLVAKALPGRDGSLQAGLFRNPVEGLHLLAYQSNDAFVELEPQKFEAYLLEEGLEHISRWRAAAGTSAARARELYQRAAKSLIEVGNGSHVGFDRILGLPLEIVPLVDPTLAPEPLHPLRAQVLFQGRPLEGALLVAMAKADPKQLLRQRTDGQGAAEIQLPQGGVWMLKVVWMEPAVDATKADVQSYWSSLTFEAHATQP